MNFVKLASGWIVLVVLAAALSAQRVPSPDRAPAVTETFLDKAVEWNSAEAQMARLATVNATNMRVREFADMLTKDHTDALQKFVQLRAEQRRGLRSDPVLPGEYPPITEEHRSLLNRLSQAAEDFDKTYLEIVVAEHRVALQLFESQAASVPFGPLEIQIIAAAVQALPRMKVHMQQAEVLLRNLK